MRNTTALVENNSDSAPNKNATALHKSGCCHHRGCYTREHSSNHFSTAHWTVQAADRSGFRSSSRYSSNCVHHLTAKNNCGRHLTVQRMADCHCRRARLIVNFRSLEPGCFQNRPTAAGLHARNYLLVLRHSGDWNRIPVARVRGPSRFPVPTSFAIRRLRGGSATCCYSPMRVH